MRNLIFIIIALVAIPSAFSISLQDLIGWFNFDFSNEAMEVLSFNDLMLDRDLNGIDDALVIELETNGNAGNYMISAILHDLVDIRNESNQSLKEGTNTFDIVFPTEFLTKNKLNYSIKIYDDNYSLIYSKENIETQELGEYETPFKLGNITDQKTGEGLLIAITFSSTKNNFYNLLAYLKYNNSAIFEKINFSSETGESTLLLNFSNEAVRNTHHIGEFNLSLKINENLVKTDYSTTNYDYKDFSQSSYFKEFDDHGIDLDGNMLYDYLALSALLEIKSLGNYDIEMHLYDLFGNFIEKVESRKEFESGSYDEAINFNGAKIYNKKLNGPFILKDAKLIKDGIVEDELINAHITDYYNYSSFEAPPLPDLKLSIESSKEHHYGSNNISINISVKNIGRRPAFNIFLEVFDNESFSSNTSRNILQPDEAMSYSIVLNNISDIELMSIADFDNFVEEIREDNNIAKLAVKINKNPRLEDISSITANESDLILIVPNAVDEDPVFYSINGSRFEKKGNAFYWHTRTIDSGNYTFMVNASDGYLYDFRTFNIEILDNPELDSDNDGINESLDNIIGDKESINSASNLSLFIENSSNISKVFSGIKKVEFRENNMAIAEFEFDFSSKLNLSKVRIAKQNNNETGSIIFTGVDLNGRTKALYLDKLNALQNGVCIKDAEIISINEISPNCDLENETKVECNGILQNGYTCSLDGFRYRVSGLKHSGIQQINYAAPVAAGESLSQDAGIGPGSAGGSGSCIEKWVCTGWSACSNSMQQRSCQDQNKCGTLISKPSEEIICNQNMDQDNDKELAERLKDSNSEEELQSNKYTLPKITGFFAAFPEDSDFRIGTFIISIILVSGLYAYFHFYKD